jgi:hypothetical protein
MGLRRVGTQNRSAAHPCPLLPKHNDAWTPRIMMQAAQARDKNLSACFPRVSSL